MNGSYLFNRFQLDDDLIFDNQVDTETDIDLYTFVNDRHSFFRFNFQTALLQFVDQYSLVRRFKQTRAKTLCILKAASTIC